MAYIGKKPEDAFRGLAYYDTFTGDGSTTTFDLSADAPDGGQNDITVVVDNVRQEPGASKSYTLGLDGSSRYRRVTFNTAPDNLSEIYVINPGRSTSLVQVSDNTISAAKLQTDAVTTAKIQDDAVTSAKIADGTIVSSNIAPGTIANDRLANTGITINGTSIALGASGEIVAGTDWQAVVVADGSTQLNAVAGKGYFLDTNAGVIDVKLPSSPTRGDTIVLADYGNNFATNRVVVDTGGKLIDSVVGGEPGSGGFTIETNGAVVELVFADNTAGWIIKQNNVPADLGAEDYSAYISATGGTVTTSGDFKIHTFTGDGCFVVSSLGNQCSSGSTVDYLVVAGGAGGGSATSAHAGGGGGAGGFRESKDSTLSSPHTASPLAATTGLTVATTTYPVTVGGGGAGSSAPTSKGTSGSNSVFSTITSTGGGGGGSEGGGTGAPIRPGNSGGSGGGGTSQTAGTGGSGNTPPTSPSQGFPGGTGTDTPPSLGNGGGGGATQAGQALQPSPFIQGAGGTGATTSISGTPTSYAGGGGGAGFSGAPSTTGGTGGTGGGGAGGPGTGGASPGTAGTVNTGGGGGGGAGASPPFGTSVGGSGGSGIVIIRYKFQ
jgi:hypothetical protein